MARQKSYISVFRFVSYSTLQCGSGSTHIGIGLRLDQDAGGTINAICCVQELRDDGDRLPGRGEHSLQGEEEQHARQDTRQKEGLERERYSSSSPQYSRYSSPTSPQYSWLTGCFYYDIMYKFSVYTLYHVSHYQFIKHYKCDFF